MVPSKARTIMLYTLSVFVSLGASKLGDTLKVTAPVVELILNKATSTPPLKEYDNVVLASTSVAVTVYTAVEVLTFSGVVAVPLDMIVGASFAFVTVIATALSVEYDT